MEIYQVKRGDSLAMIARDVLGDARRWREIATLNAVANPDLIVPGMQLVMPEPSAPTVGPPIDRAGSTATDNVGSNTMMFLAIGAGLLLLMLGRTR